MFVKTKTFIANHYLALTYLIVALLFVLGLLFNNNLHFLILVLASLVVIGVYTGIGAFSYMTVRALFADHCIDRRSIKITLLLVVALVVLYPVLKNGLDYEDINHLYLLAPLASWPAFLSIFILNIITKWGKHREKKRQQKQQQ